MQAPVQVTGIHYPKVHLGSNVEDRSVYSADHRSINSSGDVTFEIDLAGQGSSKYSKIADLSNGMVVLKFEAVLQRANVDPTPVRFSHHAFIRSLVKSNLKINGQTIYNNNQYQGLVSTSIIKHDFAEDFMDRFDGYVMNKTGADASEIGGQTYWQEQINEKAKNLADPGEGKDPTTTTMYFVIGIPLVVLDTFYAKAKCPMQKLELKLTCGSMNDMVSKRYIHADGNAEWNRNTSYLKSFKLDQGSLIVPLIELAPLSIVQLEENGDKPFAIAINYQKMKINTMALTNTTNNKSLTVTNGRSLEVYIPESGESLKCFCQMPYERLSFSAGGVTFPKQIINNYPEINCIAHGIKQFCMKPRVQGSTNYRSIETLDSSVHKYKQASMYYPHSFDLSLSDINDELYECSPDKNTVTGALQLNFGSAPDPAKKSLADAEWDYANALVLQREDIICEFRKVGGVFTPVIVTNDV
ncbi:hypothetical protein KIPB_005192 [Kipferlia bialata]|uniref:Uncharacterized protein n=1 Tax=Kipferlia bialata TaxID=797122 RepID=A0A391NW57_9EUKA|nr:hypothetical protein KIPB_005192 [Kipferlia bialata]|eukprot:g5192.t1